MKVWIGSRDNGFFDEIPDFPFSVIGDDDKIYSQSTTEERAIDSKWALENETHVDSGVKFKIVTHVKWDKGEDAKC